MKHWLFAASAIALVATGCTPKTEPAKAPVQAASVAPVKLTADEERGKFCRVCVVDKGEKIEEFFPARLDTKWDGKTYKLCSDNCKKKFDADPKRYALK